MMNSKFAKVVPLLLFLTLASAAESQTKLSFISGGKRIGVEHFAPARTPSLRTIVVLHGAGGPLLDGPVMREMSRSLAAAGDNVYFIHYFNRTGTFFGLDSNMHTHFSAWLATVKDAINFAATDSKTPGPVGVYGYSLGGFLAVAAASDSARVSAVVEQAGGVWDNNETLIGRMPPVLAVHGRVDKRVPFAKYAEPLAAILRNRHALAGTLYIPNEGHVFTAAANAEVRSKAVPFFAHHLRSTSR